MNVLLTFTETIDIHENDCQVENHVNSKYAPIGEILRRARLAKGLKQKHIADKLGCKVATISRWERGQSHPQGHFLGPLGELLGLPVNWHIGVEGSSAQPAATVMSHETKPTQVQTPAASYDAEAFAELSERVKKIEEALRRRRKVKRH